MAEGLQVTRLPQGGSVRSFIRWAGSKRRALHHLRGHWTGSPARYVEPFAGSACLFFDLQPRNAVLGDINGELMCAMHAVKQDPYLVLECYRRLHKSRRGYYTIRALDARSLSEAERAARFLYLNRYCFNGLYRTNSKGQFNVPYGPPKSHAPLDGQAIINASRALQNALLVTADFQVTLSHARSGDFVYLDPPYVTSSRRVFCEYLPGSFNKDDLQRLGETLRELSSRGAVFLITYGDSPEARELLAPWNPRRFRTRRNIAGFCGDRRDSYELVATNGALGSSS
jgi:DNA adenine methylase